MAPNYPDIFKKYTNLASKEDSKDITFEFEDSDVKIKAHKFLLEAVSPVFATMLSESWKEKDNAKIRDVRPEIFQKMIDIIYLKEIVVININDAFEIYILGEMYELEDFKVISKKFLIDNCKPSNCILMFDKAQHLGIKEVSEKCKSFFKSDSSRALLGCFLLDEEISEETFLTFMDLYNYRYDSLYQTLEFLILTGKIKSYKTLLPRIPFLTMSIQWIVSSSLLSDAEKIAIISNKDGLSIDKPPIFEMPENFSRISNSYNNGITNTSFYFLPFFLSSIEYADLVYKRANLIDGLYEVDCKAFNNFHLCKSQGKLIKKTDFKSWHEHFLKTYSVFRVVYDIKIINDKNVEFINVDTGAVFYTMELSDE